MKTALELIKEANSTFTEHDYLEHLNTMAHLKKIMIEFAKIHVESALKKASEKATVILVEHEEIPDGSFRAIWGINKNSIINAYPLENIK